MESVRIALAQQLVLPGDVVGNLDRAVGMITKAASEGCEIVVLPECLDVGWGHQVAAEQLAPIPGASSDALAAAAAENSIVVVAGLTELAGDKTYNSAVTFDTNGLLVHLHRKISEVEFARAIYSQGTSVAVVDVGEHRIGVTICADNLIESIELGRAIGRMGADLLLSPSAWAVRPDRDVTADPYGGGWETSYRTLAREYGMAVVGVSNVGPVIGGAWHGWSCIGSSLAVGADGEVAFRGRYGPEAEQLGIVDLPLRAPQGA